MCTIELQKIQSFSILKVKFVLDTQEVLPGHMIELYISGQADRFSSSHVFNFPRRSYNYRNSVTVLA